MEENAENINTNRLYEIYFHITKKQNKNIFSRKFDIPV